MTPSQSQPGPELACLCVAAPNTCSASIAFVAVRPGVVFSWREAKPCALATDHKNYQKQGSIGGRQGTKVMIMMEDDHHPVDIDIALARRYLKREFADHLIDFLSEHGRETHSVGVVLRNPEKSKHLETATMKVGSFYM